MCAALVVLAVAAAPAPAPQPADIVVIAERMQRLKLVTRTDRKTGKLSCLLKRSSGDPAFDALMCRTVLACVPHVKTQTEMETCVGPHVAAYAKDLAGGGRQPAVAQPPEAPLPPAARPR